MKERVQIREVSLRDGIQSLDRPVETAAKLRWLDLLVKAGISEIEAASMVPDTGRIIQFRDADAIVGHAVSLPGVTVSVLALNRRGAERAMALGVDKAIYVLSVSEAFSMANVRRSREESFAGFVAVAEALRALPEDRRPLLSAGFSCVFGSGFEAATPLDEVRRWAARAAEVGVCEIILADTVGYATPGHVRDLFKAVAAEVGPVPLVAHFHDTRGMAMANAFAALDAGVRAFDSSLGGLGGCPNAPGATGNIDTEDLVFMLESMGLDTGIDIDRLLVAREFVARSLPDTGLTGKIAAAGLPRPAA